MGKRIQKQQEEPERKKKKKKLNKKEVVEEKEKQKETWKVLHISNSKESKERLQQLLSFGCPFIKGLDITKTDEEDGDGMDVPIEPCRGKLKWKDGNLICLDENCKRIMETGKKTSILQWLKKYLLCKF